MKINCKLDININTLIERYEDINISYTTPRDRSKILSYRLGYGEEDILLGNVGPSPTAQELCALINRGIVKYLNEEIEDAPHMNYVVHRRRSTREAYKYCLFTEDLEGDSVLIEEIKVPTLRDFPSPK